MKTLYKTVLSALLLAVPVASAAAHGTPVAWYGGQITEAPDSSLVEFAVRDGGIRVWVRTHDGQPVSATGKATLLTGGQKTDLMLSPRADGLAADMSVMAAAKVSAILSLTVNGGSVSVRFAQEAVVTPALSGAAAAGQQAFAKVCAVCHGVALRGSDRAPSLLHPFYLPGGMHGDDAILAAVNNGAKSHMWKLGDMPKPEGLQPGQDKEILAYIRAMQTSNSAGQAPSAMPPGMDHSHMGHDHMGH